MRETRRGRPDEGDLMRETCMVRETRGGRLGEGDLMRET